MHSTMPKRKILLSVKDWSSEVRPHSVTPRMGVAVGVQLPRKQAFRTLVSLLTLCLRCISPYPTVLQESIHTWKFLKAHLLQV